MTILSASELTKTYGTDVILDRVSFHINEGDRVGIVGANGAGKTTLLRLLSGQLQQDGGGIFIARDTVLGYLRQKDEFNPQNTLLAEAEEVFSHLSALEAEMEALSARIPELPPGGEQEALVHRHHDLQLEYENAGGYAWRSEVRGMLSGMAFPEGEWQKPVAALSGGEKTRLALACLLLAKPDLLFLDEPTNHLDLGTLKWLEQYLKGYKGTLLVVSHDRYFLDQTVNRIFEIENRRLRIYEGNYSEFAEKKRNQREDDLKHYQQQQKEIARQEEIIRRFKGHGTEKLVKRAQSREKQLARLERLEAPDPVKGKVRIRFKEEFKSGQDVLLGDRLAMGFRDGPVPRDLFRNVSFDIKRGEKICLVGPNGIGKTTLFRILLGQAQAREGRVKIGHNVKFGYYDQEQKLSSETNTVLEEMKDAYRLYTDTEMRAILGRFLFRGDQVFLPVSALSGGERARLSLLKMLLSGANVLLLDEPTNHLDIDSKEVFEDALMDFPGTVLAISHDRYFLRKIPGRILELGRDGLTEYLGNFDYYTEKKESVASGRRYLSELAPAGEGDSAKAPPDPGAAETAGTAGSAAEERRRRKEEEAARRREAREAETLEREIEELEARIEEITERIGSEEAMKDPAVLRALAEELQNTKAALEGKYEKWLQ
jgi:ATP-binding cassette subfamily F protein 3